MAIEPPSGRSLQSITAMRTLARRGLTLFEAKRTIEAALEGRRIVVTLPIVEDIDVVVQELAAAGFAASPGEGARPVAVSALRERLNLTDEQFALRFGLEVETVRSWESGKGEPDATARSYLRAIENAPDMVARAYANDFR